MCIAFHGGSCITVAQSRRADSDSGFHESFFGGVLEGKYLLKRGKGNAYVEFDAQAEEVHEQTNRLTGETELFLYGTVDLSGRNPQGFDNY